MIPSRSMHAATGMVLVSSQTSPPSSFSKHNGSSLETKSFQNDRDNGKSDGFIYIPKCRKANSKDKATIVKTIATSRDTTIDSKNNNNRFSALADDDFWLRQYVTMQSTLEDDDTSISTMGTTGTTSIDGDCTLPTPPRANRSKQSRSRPRKKSPPKTRWVTSNDKIQQLPLPPILAHHNTPQVAWEVSSITPGDKKERRSMQTKQRRKSLVNTGRVKTLQQHHDLNPHDALVWPQLSSTQQPTRRSSITTTSMNMSPKPRFLDIATRTATNHDKLIIPLSDSKESTPASNHDLDNNSSVPTHRNNNSMRPPTIGKRSYP
ncbi:unknown protein [Seminavis robusta]|uniref:Uncharacterized protein n=1 Tax=Seminavis robusta TaxID=568900 RepID=A0A9N8HXM3_9STRA|nr:unknown protein [Seminavis robusta]|eukprot:Sro3202_g345140.1 n/a (320) ;mRNA; f:6411-7370